MTYYDEESFKVDLVKTLVEIKIALQNIHGELRVSEALRELRERSGSKR